MRKWIPVVLIGLAVAGYIATNVGSSMALSDITARPVVALARDGQAIAVQRSGEVPRDPAKAQLVGGQGIAFGYQWVFGMPDDTQVSCAHRFTSLTCAAGWRAERQP